jgi:hypothetical protein
MEMGMSFRRPTIALAIAAAATLMGTATAYAAMDATLSSDHGRPGDWVLLLTDDNNGIAIYNDLSTEGNQPIFLAPTAGEFTAGCGGAGSKMVGRLTWRGNRAGVAFRVPSLSLGTYYVFMETHAQCWRVAGMVSGAHGPLVLAIGNTSAENQDGAATWSADSLGPPLQVQPSQPPRQQAAASASMGSGIVVIGAFVIIVLVVAGAAWWQRRQRIHR